MVIFKDSSDPLYFTFDNNHLSVASYGGYAVLAGYLSPTMPIFWLHILTPVTNFFVFFTALDQFALTADINFIIILLLSLYTSFLSLLPRIFFLDGTKFDIRTGFAYFKLLQTLISERDKMDFVKRLAGVMTLLMSLAAIYTEAQGQTQAGRTLIVGTKEVPPFAMKNSEGTWTGVSIDLWQQIASELSLPFEFQELDLQGLLDGVADGSLDVAVAALSITAEREELCDFSHPYYVTGLGIATAPKHKTPWLVVLKKLFSSHYLKVVSGLCVLLLALGTLIWWFEHKRNPDQFGGGTAAGIGSGFWWSAVTMTTVGYGDKAPITFCGRVVAFIWMLLAIIIVSVFTATITSTLTVAHLDVPVKGPQDLPKVRVGAIANTIGETYLQDNLISSTSYKTVSEGLRAV